MYETSTRTDTHQKTQKHTRLGRETLMNTNRQKDRQTQTVTDKQNKCIQTQKARQTSRRTAYHQEKRHRSLCISPTFKISDLSPSLRSSRALEREPWPLSRGAYTTDAKSTVTRDGEDANCIGIWKGNHDRSPEALLYSHSSPYHDGEACG